MDLYDILMLFVPFFYGIFMWLRLILIFVRDDDKHAKILYSRGIKAISWSQM
jgi:hypothetical protein